MKKRSTSKNDDMRPEYDFSPQPGRVQGKYYRQAMAGTNLVLIEPEIAEVFPTGKAVNAALRRLMRKSHTRKVRRQSKPHATRRRAR
jgi:hypothetical protein